MSISITARDSEIIDALVHRVRVLSLEQIGRTWWSGSTPPTKQAASRMNILATEKLVTSYQAFVHPELVLSEPIVQWNPEDQMPDFGAAAYRLQSRWIKPFVSVTCFIATNRSGRAFGGYGGRRSRSSEQTHDIHLAAVFLRYRAEAPHLVADWRSEAAILATRSNRREKLPDALIDNGEERRIIEFGGSYGKDKLVAFHEYCEREELPYEIW